MSDDVKDFHYYADKAESALNEAAEWDDQMLNPVIRQRLTHAADVYARLATGAPKHAVNTPKEGPCYGKLSGPNPDLYYPCIRGYHSEGLHQTAKGAWFHD